MKSYALYFLFFHIKNYTDWDLQTLQIEKIFIRWQKKCKCIQVVIKEIKTY